MVCRPTSHSPQMHPPSNEDEQSARPATVTIPRNGICNVIHKHPSQRTNRGQAMIGRRDAGHGWQEAGGGRGTCLGERVLLEGACYRSMWPSGQDVRTRTSVLVR